MQICLRAKEQQQRYDTAQRHVPGGADYCAVGDKSVTAIAAALVDQQRYIAELRANADQYGPGYAFGIGSEVDANHPATALLSECNLVSAPLEERYVSSILPAFIQQARVWRDDRSYPAMFRDHITSQPHLAAHLASAATLRLFIIAHVGAVAAADTSPMLKPRIAETFGTTAVWSDFQVHNILLPHLADAFNVAIQRIRSITPATSNSTLTYRPRDSSDAARATFSIIEVPTQWYGTLMKSPSVA